MLKVEIARKSDSSLQLEEKSHENISTELPDLQFVLKIIVMKIIVRVDLKSTGQEAWMSLKESLQILQ